MRSDLGQVATRAPASVSLPTEGQLREARLFLQYFAHTPHSREFPSPPAEPGAAGSPTLRGGTAGGGSDVGPPLPVPPPAPAPNVGAPRAPRPRWPRYCFTFPGVYFSLIGKKRDGGRSERGLRFPLPGHARRAPDRPGEGLGPDPRAEPAPRSPPPSPPPAPGSRLPAPPPLRAPPALPPDTDLAPGSLPSCVGPAADSRGARLWGRAAFSLSPRSRTGSRSPAPPESPPLQPGPLHPKEPRAGRGRWPGREAPPPSRPFPRPRRRAARPRALELGARRGPLLAPGRTCQVQEPPQGLGTGGVWARQP